MQSNLDFSVNCNEYISCVSDMFNPECGKKCHSTKSSEDYLEYTFEGVKFEIYGSYASNNGEFELKLDGQSLIKINLSLSGESIHRTKIYSSDILEYQEHTIRIQGLQNQRFEIYKITYWPSLHAKRLNVSDFNSIGCWQSESDNAGGERAWTNDIGAKKYATIECSRVWVYGTRNFNHGEITIKFNDETHVENQQSQIRYDSTLMYKSDEVPFGSYEIQIENAKVDNTILFYCVYYLYEFPSQTSAPHPSRTFVPDTSMDYINKHFIKTIPPDGFIDIQEGSPIKQVSGCTFTNIETDDFMIKPLVEIVFYDNAFEYTDPNLITKTVMWTKVPKFTFTSCTFKNFKDTINELDGTIFSANLDCNFTLESCKFINCCSNESSFMFKLNSVNSNFKAFDCTFSFDDLTKNGKICNFKFTDVLFDECTFTRSGNEMIKFNWPINNGVFTFTNNIVEYNIKTFINADRIPSNPVISNNIFRHIDMESDYLFSILHEVDEIDLINNTFTNINSNENGKYGGGVSIWIQRNVESNKGKFSLNIIECKFYDISNPSSQSPYNQGGALQLISDVEMTFQNCEFKLNRCLNGMGGALGININRNLIITECIFEDNEAGNKGGAIYIWRKIEKQADDTEAPKFSGTLEMDTINITNCQFINNKGDEGHAIYIDKENIENVTVDILLNTLLNNGEDDTKYMIFNYCPKINFENNSFKYIDSSKSSGAIKNACELDTSTINIIGSNFINCTSKNFAINVVTGHIEVDNISITFSETNNAGGGINLGNKGFNMRNVQITRTRGTAGAFFEQNNSTIDPVVIINCTFDNCECRNNINRCFLLSTYTESFTFTNITIQNMIERGNTGYSGVININNALDTFVIDNLKIINNSCNSDYCGGSGLWIVKTNKILFNNCSFINNAVLKSPNSRTIKPVGQTEYFSGDGGGIQYGFTTSLSNHDIIFNECLFRQNKAVRHGGTIALQMIQAVEIINCTFESNFANYQPASFTSSDLLFENHFNKKTEGRGGAIYLNPSFTTNQGDFYTKSIKIEGCKFIQNKAFDGQAIYIEGDECETNIMITDNDFIDNYDRDSQSGTQSVIVSEIDKVYINEVLNLNRFSYQDSSIYVSPLKYVDHYGNAPTATPTPIPTPFKTNANISNNSSIDHLYNIEFECPIDRGLIKFYLSCQTCNVKEGIYFIVRFENQKISRVEYDERPIIDDNTLSSYVIREKIKYIENNNSISFVTSNNDIKYEHSLTENRLKCYIPTVDYVMTDKDCSPDFPCEKIDNESRPVHVFILNSSFIDFDKTSRSGGAVYLINCGLTCKFTPFTNCISNNGGGGGIYVNYKLDYRNNVTLSDLVFTKCKAKFGAAVCLLTKSFRVPVRFNDCNFFKNELIESDDPSHDGNAIYLDIIKGIVDGCDFNDNVGGKFILKIQTKKDDNEESRGLIPMQIPNINSTNKFDNKYKENE